MKIELRLFAGVREALGTDALVLELPNSATISALREQLNSEYPEISTVVQHSRFAIEQSYASDETVIPVGSIVACIPPVSGG